MAEASSFSFELRRLYLLQDDEGGEGVDDDEDAEKGRDMNRLELNRPGI
jgi:hypothetical protein